jgi:hypothetical protein
MKCKNNNKKNLYYYFDKRNNISPKLKNKKFNIYNKKISIQSSIFLMDIIMHNPYIVNERIKKILLKKIINYLKELCEVIKDIKNNNKSKFNYFTGKTVEICYKQINDINYKEINDNKNKQLNKNNILKSLREHKNEFKTYSIKKYKEEINKKNNIEINMDDKLGKNIGINILDKFIRYSKYNINKEWKSMKNVWNQNNNRLNPLFKVNETNSDSKSNNNCNNDKILYKYNIIEKEETIEFDSILNLNTNQ